MSSHKKKSSKITGQNLIKVKQDRKKACPSGKDRFKDAVSAKWFIASKGTEDKLRAYKCHLCPRWHVTSQVKKKKSH